MARVKKIAVTGYGAQQLYFAALSRFDTANKADMWTAGDYEAADEVISTLRPLPERKAVSAPMSTVLKPKDGKDEVDIDVVLDEIDKTIDVGSVEVRLSPEAFNWVVARLDKIQSPPVYSTARNKLNRALRQAVDETV